MIDYLTVHFQIKAQKLTLSYLDQTERQKLRVVCPSWKNLIDEEFPIQLLINQTNYERLFQCPNASKVEIHNLTTEYTGNIAFGSKLQSVQFTGKVLSSNIFTILRFCPEIEKLSFSSLKQVMGIEDVETVKSPKVTAIEIRVRPDQETFTSDEIIIISVLRQIVFGSLETILISTGTPYENWEDEGDYNQSEGSDEVNMISGGFTVSNITPMSMSTHLDDNDSSAIQSVEAGVPNQVLEPTPENIPAVPADQTTEGNLGEEPDTSEPNNAGTQTANTNLHVIINRTANFPDPSGSDAVTSTSRASSRSSTSRRMRYHASEFEARLFRANLELLVLEGDGSDALTVLNDSSSRTRIDDSATYFEIPGMPTPAVKHTVFFEFVRNNHSSLKNLHVKTRSEFMCFGNLNGFTRDVNKVQFEEVDYSFGRMQMCYEHLLLRAQCKLKKLKVQILDDLWKHLILAVANSRETLLELDIKVMSVSDDRVDITPITQCSNLKCLKLLHFFEKESLSELPKTLNRLVLNGPLTYQDMDSWTRELVDLMEVSLLLNVRGDKIDLPLYKRFLKMPKLTKLTLIQCPIDLEAIQEYINHTLPSRTGLEFKVTGPVEIADIPSIQYVYTTIHPDKFNRQQIEIE